MLGLILLSAQHMKTGYTVFYSWQSDETSATDSRTNRYLIHDALERAAKRLEREDIALVDVDRDTEGVGGAPEIASTIFRKIEAADGFIADVTIVNPGDRARPSPNPNVLIELGYTLKSLGDDAVTLVFNEASGSIDDLPFDLRGRRVNRYRLQAGSETDERRAEREKLVSLLYVALRGLVETLDRKRAAVAEVERTQATADSTARLETARETLAEWASESRARFEETVREVTNRGVSDLYPHGMQEAAYAVVPTQSLGLSGAARLNALKAAKRDFTGWPVWTVLEHADVPEFRPRLRGGNLERLAVMDGDPYSTDFWRADGEGRLYLVRGYREDRGQVPGAMFDPDQPIKNVAEVLAHAKRFAEAVTDEDAAIAIRLRFDGLAGRIFGSMSPIRDWHPNRSSDGAIDLEHVASVSGLNEDLPKVAFEILSPLYELFDLHELNERHVVSVIEDFFKRAR